MAMHDHDKMTTANMAKDCCNAAREQTVGEYLDDRIFQAVRVADALRDLKASLPGSFLGSGASRISALTLRVDMHRFW